MCQALVPPAPARPTASAKMSGKATPVSAMQVGSAELCHPCTAHAYLSLSHYDSLVACDCCPICPLGKSHPCQTLTDFSERHNFLSSLFTPQGTMEGTVWTCVTSTPARTSQCVAASQAHPWAMCVSVEETSLGSTASTGEIQDMGQGMPGSVLPSHPGSVTRDLSVPLGSLELLNSWADRRRGPGGFGGCNSRHISL